MTAEAAVEPTGDPYFRLRRWAVAAWVAALAVCLVGWGFPLERGAQTVWILALLFAANLGRPWSAQRRILVDWLPFVFFFYVYDYTRGLADTLGRPVHVAQVADAEAWLFHGTIPTVWLQARFYVPGEVRWYDTLTSLVYFSHFIVVWAIAVAFYLRSREEWVRWARRLLVLSYAGLVTYVLFPAAPPWYASDAGVIGEVHRIASRGWDTLGLQSTGALVRRGQASVNDVAAVPSLHAAFAFLVLLFFWHRVGVVVRALLVVYTVTMAAALVYGGEHYVVDALLGYVYVVLTVLAVGAWERRRAARSESGERDEVAAHVADGVH